MPIWVSRLLTLSVVAIAPIAVYAMLTNTSWVQFSFGLSPLKILAAQIAMACSIIGLELLVVGWEKSSARSFFTTRSSRSDIFSFLLIYTGLGAVIGIALGLGVAWHIGQIIGGALKVDLIRMIPHVSVQVAVGFVWLSFVGYAVHYAEHHVPFLWELHKQHHSAEEFSVLTAYRYAPISFAGVFTAIPAGIVGAPLESVYAIGIIQQLHIFLIHSRLRWTFGAIGRGLVVSPNYHRLHHSANPADFDANFGVDLVIWDRLFGTYRDPRTKVEFIGVPGEPQGGYVHDSIRSMKGAYGVMATNASETAHGAARAVMRRVRHLLPE